MPVLMVCCAFYGFAGPDPDEAWTSMIQTPKTGLPDASEEEIYCEPEDEGKEGVDPELCAKAGEKLYNEDWSLYLS